MGGAFLISILLFFAGLSAQQSPSMDLAEVNGETITESDVFRVAGGNLRQLEDLRPPTQAAYEREKLAIRWRALNYLIERKLVRAEAARQMISEDDLMEREVEGNMEKITPELVEAFFETNKVRMPLTERLSRREALSQVRAYMTEQSWNAQRDVYIDQLTKRHQVKTYLEPLRLDIPTAGHPVRGSASAAVTIIEFSDFDCVPCASVASTLTSLQKEYGEKIRVVFRQFPLTYKHPRAQKAAEASLCAHDQNRFWEFHDTMFGNQADLSTDGLKATARSLKLDTAAFDACLDSGSFIDSVNKQIDEGYSTGVKVTPTIFVNGRMLVGNRDSLEIRKLIDEELGKIR
jgi:protein-disulfide isomerase